MNKTKNINYKGLLSFSIPENWIEEYEDEGGGMFYENLPNSGTLRLNIISVEPPYPITHHHIEEIMNMIPSPIKKSIILPNKNGYKHYVEHKEEEGQNISIYFWILVGIKEPDMARIANFSYTILSNQEKIKSVIDEIGFINEQIKLANFKF